MRETSSTVDTSDTWLFLLTRDGVESAECPVQPGGERGGAQHVSGEPGQQPTLSRQQPQETRVTPDVAEVLIILPTRVHHRDWQQQESGQEVWKVSCLVIRAIYISQRGFINWSSSTALFQLHPPHNSIIIIEENLIKSWFGTSSILLWYWLDLLHSWEMIISMINYCENTKKRCNKEQ